MLGLLKHKEQPAVKRNLYNSLSSNGMGNLMCSLGENTVPSAYRFSLG